MKEPGSALPPQSVTSACASALPRSEKIAARHLDRLAYVYVRQSTPQQLVRHQESTQIQYNLRRRAVDLGWSTDRVQIVDEDLGKSGASAEGRLGFQRMLAEVALDHVGIILGVEMSRLARSCKDWYHLLEVCGLFGTLIADLDGVYDPSQYNDRLLLGLKGTMSEAELHILKQRMYQGSLNKARRGELVCQVPMGYVRLPSGEVAIDPDEEVQSVIRLAFRKFEELGSVHAVLRFFVKTGVGLPVRPHYGPRKGELEWHPPNRGTLNSLLKNPMYAGVYAYGRRLKDPGARASGQSRDGRKFVPQDRWHAFLKDRYPAYITWDEYQAHLERLKSNREASGGMGIARDGSALVPGLVTCGRCGKRMSVSYDGRGELHTYVCGYMQAQYGQERCQSIPGRVVDGFVKEEVLKALEPVSLDLSMKATENIQRQRDEADALRQKRLERARYEAGRAERLYACTEPENRLVGRELARRWEEKLRVVRDLEEEYDRFSRSQPRVLSPEEREAIRLLAKDIPSLWSSPRTTHADRKEIVRQVIDRVVLEVLENSERVRVQVEWAGGAQTTHEIQKPVHDMSQLSYWPQVSQEIRRLASEGSSAGEIARRLHEKGWRLASRARFTEWRVCSLARRLRVRLHSSRPKDRSALGENEWWLSDLADELGMHKVSLLYWIRNGWVPARQSESGLWIVQADPDTLGRLRILRDAPRGFEARKKYLREHSLLGESPVTKAGG